MYEVDGSAFLVYKNLIFLKTESGKKGGTKKYD